MKGLSIAIGLFLKRICPICSKLFMNFCKAKHIVASTSGQKSETTGLSVAGADVRRRRLSKPIWTSSDSTEQLSNR